jgi:hypothetical protein
MVAARVAVAMVVMPIARAIRLIAAVGLVLRLAADADAAVPEGFAGPVRVAALAGVFPVLTRARRRLREEQEAEEGTEREEGHDQPQAESSAEAVGSGVEVVLRLRLRVHVHAVTFRLNASTRS